MPDKMDILYILNYLRLELKQTLIVHLTHTMSKTDGIPITLFLNIN